MAVCSNIIFDNQFIIVYKTKWKFEFVNFQKFKNVKAKLLFGSWRRYNNIGRSEKRAKKIKK